MDWFVKAFLKSSLVWLGAGVTLGLAIAMHPAWAVYRTAHLHMNLLGFVGMMIFGVAYHVIPRFTGHRLHSHRLAGLQWWIANTGLLVFVAGFVLLPHTMFGTPARFVVAAGGILSAAGAYIFVYNIWRTIDGPVPARAATPAVPPPAAVPLRRRSTAPRAEHRRRRRPLHSLVRRFLKPGIAFLALGLLIGAWMMVERELLQRFPSPFLVSAHTHAILVGFVMMMILGVALWLFPRPARDDARYSPRAAEAAYWLVGGGTALRVGGELARAGSDAAWLRAGTLGAGLVQIVGLFVFFYTMWSRIRPVGSQAREAQGERF